MRRGSVASRHAAATAPRARSRTTFCLTALHARLILHAAYTHLLFVIAFRYDIPFRMRTHAPRVSPRALTTLRVRVLRALQRLYLITRDEWKGAHLRWRLENIATMLHTGDSGKQRAALVRSACNACAHG